jgi:hypothetical protein
MVLIYTKKETANAKRPKYLFRVLWSYCINGFSELRMRFVYSDMSSSLQ